MGLVLLARGSPGLIEAYAPLCPDASPTVEIRNRGGSIVLASTSTGVERDAVATTLAQGYAAGVEELELTSGSDLVAGRRYFASGQGAKGEQLEVEQFSGTRVYLAGKTAMPHPSGSAFEGTRIAYSYSPPASQQPQHGWRATFGWNVGGTAQKPLVVEFGVTSHPVTNELGPWILYEIVPQLDALVHADTDLVRVVEEAWDEVLETMLVEGLDPSAIIGSNKFKRTVAYLGLWRCALQAGPDYKDERREWREAYAEELGKLKQIVTADKDADEVAGEPGDEGVDSGYVGRG